MSIVLICIIYLYIYIYVLKIIMAEIISVTESELQRAAEALRSGKLVGIPTETVYGLGGNALMDSAVRRIYSVKGRPSSDPLICHTDTVSKAVQMWHPDVDPEVIELARCIGTHIWPGPLTIVCRSHPGLPLSVTGGSGYIGARIPRHPATLRLLSMVDFPVAAPSANTFGHVSPTTAQHVYDDLAQRDPELIILDGGMCAVGIESTVIRIDSSDCVEILRRGYVCISDIQAVIAESHPHTCIKVRDTRSKYSTVEEIMDAPGQLLTHYSPKIPACLLTPASMTLLQGMPESCSAASEWTVCRGKNTLYPMAYTVVIDFGGLLRPLASRCVAYRDLSEHGSAEEACSAVFTALRWCEEDPKAQAVVFPYLSEWSLSANTGLLAAVEDRLFRAASGVTGRLMCESTGKE